VTDVAGWGLLDPAMIGKGVEKVRNSGREDFVLNQWTNLPKNQSLLGRGK
jgi:hypothetical protein